MAEEAEEVARGWKRASVVVQWSVTATLPPPPTPVATAVEKEEEEEEA
jgi:hypothetical protein